MTATALRWAGAIGIATIAVMRCVIAFAPLVRFDIDPAESPARFAGLGPAGSLLLDGLLLAAAACALLGEALARRGIDRTLVVLVAVPVPIVLWHGVDDAGDLWRGMTWVAAAAAAVAAAHLGRERALRSLLLALLAAVLVPVGLRGAMQSSVAGLDGPEYAETIREFEDHRDVLYADRGWTPDSPEARIYERRIRQPDPRGWFPTTNLLASMAAFGLVLLAGVSAGAVRARLPRSWITGLVAGAVLCAALLLLARSKGALGAAVIALAFLKKGSDPILLRWAPRIALGLVGLVLIGVFVRGALLPESFLGDRSLLYRWHYLVGAGRVVADHGLLGVGPDGFQPAYTAVRPPRSPEEVSSAHNVFADWLSTLGIAGAAWGALVVVLVWRAASRREPGPASPRPVGRAVLGATAAVAVAGLLPSILVESPALASVSSEIARAAGVLGYVLAAAGLYAVLCRVSAVTALAAAALGLVVHGQIEMTFYDPGSAVWVMSVVGLAGGAATRPGGRRVGAAVAGVMLVLAAVVLGLGALPARRASVVMDRAAELLYPPPESREARAERREDAALLLVAAHARMPSWAAPLAAATRQYLRAASLAEGDRRLELADRAVEVAERSVAAHGTPASIAAAAEARAFRASLTGTPRDWEAAITHARDLTRIDPHGIGPWRRLGDLLWESGRRGEAGRAYEQALANDANFELDPMKRLSERDRETLQERITRSSQ